MKRLVFFALAAILAYGCTSPFDSPEYTEAYETGKAFYAKNDFEGSEQKAVEAYQIARSNNNLRGQANASFLLGLIGKNQGHYDYAYSYFLQARRHFGVLDDSYYRNKANLEVAFILNKTGKFLEARNLLGKAVVYFQKNTNAQNDLAYSYWGLAQSNIGLEQSTAAKSYLYAVKSIAAEPISNGYVFLELGKIYTKERNPDSSLHFLYRAKDLAEAAHSQELLNECYYHIYQTHWQQEDYANAITAAEQAVDLSFSTDELIKYRIVDAKNLGNAYLQVGRVAEARQAFERVLPLEKSHAHTTAWQGAVAKLLEICDYQQDMEAIRRYGRALARASQLPKAPSAAEQRQALQAAIAEADAEDAQATLMAHQPNQPWLPYLAGGLLMLLATGGYILYQLWQRLKSTHALAKEQESAHLHWANSFSTLADLVEKRHNISQTTLQEYLQEATQINQVLGGLQNE